MTLPSFNLDEALADRAKYIGEVPWLSTQSLQITNIAPHQEDAEKAIVVVSKQHGLVAGERVFVAGYGPTIDHFYTVEEHTDPKHRKAAFVIELNISDRLGPGLLYAPQTFQILHPQHLAMDAHIEMQALELRHMEVLKAISPQNYRKTMLLLLKGLGSSASADSLKADIEALTSKIGVDDGGEEIDPQAIAKIQSIELDITMREIEILCSMPKGHMSVMAQKAGMGDVIKQIHGFIGGLIKTADMERNMPDELRLMMQRVSSDLSVPQDRLQTAKHFGFGDLIKQIHLYIKAEEAEATAKKPRSRKPNANTETIAKAS